jgi:formamidopyrimidine-DNA glycosylase
MPELPEVEAFGQWLLPQVRGQCIDTVEVLKPRLVRPVSVFEFRQAVEGVRIQDLRRRGKCLLWDCVRPSGEAELLVTHLGMTGSWRILPGHEPLPRHAAVAFGIGAQRVVLEDPRQFGHLRLGNAAVPELGPEPLDPCFTPELLGKALAHGRRPIKVCLMDPSRLAGVGNLYASEALFLAGIDPTTPAHSLEFEAIGRLHAVLPKLLQAAVERNLQALRSDRLMLYQQEGVPEDPFEGGLWVYDREGQPCFRCGASIVRFMQSGRSTFRCPQCQLAVK